MNVTAAVSDRSRAKRPPRLIAYAYVQRRAAPGVTGCYTALHLCGMLPFESTRERAQLERSAAWRKCWRHGPWAMGGSALAPVFVPASLSFPPSALCSAEAARRIPTHHSLYFVFIGWTWVNKWREARAGSKPRARCLSTPWADGLKTLALICTKTSY